MATNSHVEPVETPTAGEQAVENVTTNMDLLRFATAGSVDDGKSTLIGRLLLDSKSIFEDQLEAVEATSKGKGYDYTDLALLTDGLRSEREQGITIDVAYRYFATPNRKFIIADTPGHVQYTRNMVTGASTADLGLVLVDARQGLTEQSRRHAVILSLLRVPHLVLAINKMDLVDFDEKIYEKIHDEFTQFATKLSIPDLEVIPISALQGDNVVNRSENMPWYSGPTLMHHLEHVHVASDRDLIDARFPVQYVVRPKSDEFHDYRGYAGQVAGGVLKPGDEVVVLPSGMTSTISKIDLFHQEVPEAFPPMSVTISLADDVDVSRGDMIARVKNAPQPTQDLDAMVCWMTTAPLKPRQKLAIKHTTRLARALVKDIQYRLDVNTLHRDQDTHELAVNEIGRVQLRTTVPLLCDSYSKNRTTGSFILIDELRGPAARGWPVGPGGRPVQRVAGKSDDVEVSEPPQFRRRSCLSLGGCSHAEEDRSCGEGQVLRRDTPRWHESGLIRPSLWPGSAPAPCVRWTDPRLIPPRGSGDSEVTSRTGGPALTLTASPRPAATKTYRRFTLTDAISG